MIVIGKRQSLSVKAKAERKGIVKPFLTFRWSRSVTIRFTHNAYIRFGATLALLCLWSFIGIHYAEL